MRRTAFILVLLLLAPVTLLGQARGGGWILVGPTRSGLVDLSSSALRYEGWGVHGAAGWRSVGERLRVEAWIAGGAAGLDSRITSQDWNRESAYEVELRMDLLRRVATFPDRGLSLFAGAEVGLAAIGRFHSYAWGADELFADGFGTAAVAGMWEYRRQSGTVVSGTAAVPLLSVVARTPYYGLKDLPDAGVEGPLGLTGLSHTIRLERPLSPRVTALLDYRTVLVRHDAPRPLTLVRHWMGAGIELRRRAP